MINISLYTFLGVSLPGESKGMMKPLALDHMFLSAQGVILGRYNSIGWGFGLFPTLNVPFLFLSLLLSSPRAGFCGFGFLFRVPVLSLGQLHAGHLVISPLWVGWIYLM